MFSNLSNIIKIPAALLIGMTIAALVLILLYEGISLPVIGQVINGRVANAVDAATSTMATQAELDAARAVIERERALRNAATSAATEARRRAEAAAQLAGDRQIEIERLAGEARAAGNLSTPSEEDLKWYGSHP
ncbi:hypothetical protein [Rhizobium halophytocola]|uniref:Uncharacterized protein n=1 Tax=Rhizobium halophytocola TaxID=735519 RepID=A0ABS4DVI1_9HYPH|nr:hypothetical protein [Rhizobium halophytocola]MBP1849704.1 hypothetical protein [Rhizobium halophytocola]